jgi:type IX secretion system PorP/SprF family membrane protein
MKTKILIAIFLILGNLLMAQLQPIFTIYREQTALLNPAMPSPNYTVNELPHSISATYRYQWFNVPDAPITQVLTWESMLEDRNLLVGAQILNDRTGEIGSTTAYARCAYRLMFDEMDKRYLTIGMSAGGSRVYANLAAAAAEKNIALVEGASFLPDLSMGAYYQHGNRFYAGVTAVQLLNTKHQIESTNSLPTRLRLPPHLYGIFGCYLDAPFLGNDVAFFEPNVWLRYLPKENYFTFDLGLRTKISQTFWAGTSYNLRANTLNIEVGSVLGEAVGFSAGNLKIGMGFVVPLGTLIGGFGPGGEINLSYAWN